MEHERKGMERQETEKDKKRGVGAEPCNDPFLTAEWAFLRSTHTHTHAHNPVTFLC